MQVHVDRGGERFGPYSIEDVNAYLASGTLLPTDLAWHDGMTDWVSIEEIPGVTMTEGSPPPAPVAEAAANPSEEKAEESEAEDSDKIQVNRGGEPIGPYSRDKAKEYFTAGQLLPTDLGWHDGTNEWKPLNEVLGLPLPAQLMGVTPAKAKTSNQYWKKMDLEFSFDYIWLAASVAFLVVCAFYFSAQVVEIDERWQANFEGDTISLGKYHMAKVLRDRSTKKLGKSASRYGGAALTLFFGFLFRSFLKQRKGWIKFIGIAVLSGGLVGSTAGFFLPLGGILYILSDKEPLSPLQQLLLEKVKIDEETKKELARINSVGAWGGYDSDDEWWDLRSNTKRKAELKKKQLDEQIKKLKENAGKN